MEEYVIGFNQQLWPQIMMHGLTIVFMLIAVGLSIYIAILIIKALRRSIVALEIYIKKAKMNDNG